VHRQCVQRLKGTSLPPASQSTCTCRHVQCCALPTWWSWRGGCTRSHSEHGRETPLRRWYFVLRRGRVGRCQVCKAQHISSQIYENWTIRGSHVAARFLLLRLEHIRSRLVAGWSSPRRTAEAKGLEDRQSKRPGMSGSSEFIAGWSSPVARQAHNLKVAGSNPAPATKI
jgi:hypothetical protein